jgi:hypothetical protein
MLNFKIIRWTVSVRSMRETSPLCAHFKHCSFSYTPWIHATMYWDISCTLGVKVVNPRVTLIKLSIPYKCLELESLQNIAPSFSKHDLCLNLCLTSQAAFIEPPVWITLLFLYSTDIAQCVSDQHIWKDNLSVRMLLDIRFDALNGGSAHRNTTKNADTRGVTIKFPEWPHICRIE